MRYQQVLSFLVLFPALFSACKKEAANEAPHIDILAPSEDASCTLPDTLHVALEASDDHGLVQVAVTLLDHDDIPVVNAVSASVSGTYASITLALPIISEQLESGDYKLLATVTDGTLNGKDVRNIHVTAVPLRLRAVFTVVEAGANNVALYRTDSTGQTALAMNWPMDLGGAAISSRAQRFYIAGGTSGDLLALSPEGLGTIWQQANLSPVGAPWFTSVDLCADGRLYVGEDDGTLRGFTANNGSAVFNATLPEQFRSEQTITSGDLVICTERHFITQEQRLGMYFRFSGASQQTQPLDLVPVRIFERDADHVLIFGNRDGHGRVQDRNVAGGGGWEPYIWPHTISAVERVASGTWLVALSNGDLQRFTSGNAGSVSIATTPELNTLTYDQVNGIVYGGADGHVLAINPSTGAVVPGWSVNGSVRYVLPLLNR